MDSATTTVPVNLPGHPPDVTVLIVSRETGVKVASQISKETNANNAQGGFGEMIARNVLLVSKVMNVNNVLRGFREMVARNVLLVSKEMNANNARGGSGEMVARNVPLVWPLP